MSTEKVSVNRQSLERMIGRLTFPKHCRHACGDPPCCSSCHAVWEENAMKVRAGLIDMLRNYAAVEQKKAEVKAQ